MKKLNLFSEYFIVTTTSEGFSVTKTSKPIASKTIVQQDTSAHSINADNTVNMTGFVAYGESVHSTAQFIELFKKFENFGVILCDGGICFQNGFHNLGFLEFKEGGLDYVLKYMARERGYELTPAIHHKPTTFLERVRFALRRWAGA